MIDVRDIYKDVNEYLNKEVVLNGWIRNHRKQKEFGFITFFDGTVFESVQIVYDKKLENFDEIQKLRVGSAISVEGLVVKSPKEGQEFEIQASKIKLEEIVQKIIHYNLKDILWNF